MHQKSGATLQALGARMRMALGTVGAMQSMVTAVPMVSVWHPVQRKMTGKGTQESRTSVFYRGEGFT